MKEEHEERTSNQKVILNRSLVRFEEMILTNTYSYLTLEECDSLINHYLEVGNMKMADQIIHVSSDFHPKNHQVSWFKAKYFFYKANYYQALKHVALALKKNPDQPDLAYFEALTYIYIDLPEEALCRINKIEKEFAQNVPNFFYQIAHTFYLQNYYHYAIHFFKIALLKKEKNKENLLELGISYYRIGFVNKATKILKKLLDIDPFNDKAWFYLTKSNLKTLKLKKLNQYLDFALALQPKNGDYLFLQIELCIGMKKYRKAISLLKDLIEIEKNEKNNFMLLAQVYLKIKEYKNAAIYLKKVLDIDEKTPLAWYGFYKIFMNTDTGRALIFLSQAIRYDANNIRYNITFARCFWKLKNYNKALLILSTVLKKDITCKQAWLDVGKILIEMERYHEAKELIVDAYEMYPSCPKLNYMLSLIYMYQKDYPSASLHLENAAKKNKNMVRDFFTLFPDSKSLCYFSNIKISERKISKK